MSIRLHTSSALLLLAGLSVAPVAMAADAPETPCETDLCRSVRESWSSVKHGTTDAAQWTKKETVKGRDATKDGAKKAAKWTGKTSEKGWKATKNGTEKAAHDTAKWTKKTAHDITQ